ncbi:DUF3993 domain-containing protein [Aneurinibacillus sp. REN35]|uniref:DUF3993 domain-containing protein n=1 Tax=Aneurinibacillus sp. REN35 TaxID=3237286 RepID=UPI003526EAFB
MRNIWKSAAMCMVVFAVFFAPTSTMQIKEMAAGVGTEALAAQSTELDREAARTVIQQAAEAQFALNEPMTRLEALEKVRPYMTDEFSRTFLGERLMPETIGHKQGLWSIPGSDDMYLFMPSFSWDTHTDVKIQNGVAHISQYFPAEEGPWETPAHTETVVLIQEEGSWKVNEVQYK